MDRFEEMATFVAVVQEQSFAAAARRRAISPPSVTRAIAALEARIGALLLTRTTRRVRLTEAGQRYFDDCRRLLAELAGAEQSAADAQSKPRGILAITAPVLFGEMYVMPLLREYLDQYPTVDVSALFVDRVINMVDEGIDIAFRIAPPQDASLISIPVAKVRRVICAAPALLRAQGAPAHPSDLCRYRVAIASSVTPSSLWHFCTEGETFSLQPDATLSVTSVRSAIQAAECGWGLACVLSYQIANQLLHGTLVVVLEEFEQPPVPVNITYQADRIASAKVRSFVDFAAARIRADPHFN